MNRQQECGTLLFFGPITPSLPLFCVLKTFNSFCALYRTDNSLMNKNRFKFPFSWKHDALTKIIIFWSGELEILTSRLEKATERE